MRALSIALLLVVGCGRSTPLDDDGPSPRAPDWNVGSPPGGVEWAMKTLKAKGLYTFGNSNVSIPEGGMTIATNVVIDEPDVIAPRRGLPVVGGTFPSGGTADSGAFYQGKLLVHTTSSKLAYADPTLTSPTWTELTGTYAPPTGQQMRFVQASGNLYFTTSLGVYKLDAYNGTPSAAGGLAAIQAATAQTGLTGFQNANSQVAYRVLWGIKDANNNYIYGAPSGRVIQSGFANPQATTSTGLTRATSTVTATFSAAHGYVVGDIIYLLSTDANFPSGPKTVATAPTSTTLTYTEAGTAVTSTVAQSFYYATRNVSLTVNIPSGATTSHFAQVYRTAQSADGFTDPGDEGGLVYEYVPTNLDIAAGSFTFTDIAPDALRGAALYTNPSQEGISQENDPPPACVDLALFKESTLCAKAVPRQSMILTLLAVGGSAGMAINDLIHFRVDVGAVATTYGIKAQSSESSQNFQLFTSGTASQNIANTAQSLVRILNGKMLDGNYLPFIASYLSGPTDPPGRIGITMRSPLTGIDKVAVFMTAPGPRSYWSPNLQERMTGGVTRAGSTVTVNSTSVPTITASLVAVGQLIYFLSNDPVNFPSGTKTVASVTDATHFTYTESGAATTSSGIFATFGTIDPATSAPNSNLLSAVPSATNVLAVSKTSEPEAFPLLNSFTVGSQASTIQRIIPLRDSVFVFTDLDGIFRLTGTDPSNFRVDLFDPTVKLLAPKSAVTLGNRIYALTNQGVVSVDDSGVQIVSRPIEGELNTLIAAGSASAAVGASYESDRKYLLSIGSATYVYNYLTDAWTKWTTTFAWAGVDPVGGKLWLSDSTSDMRRENKALTWADYYDASAAMTGSTTGSTILLDSGTAHVGDAVLNVASGAYAVVTAVAGPSLTMSSSVATWGTQFTIYTAFTSQVQWSPDELSDSGKLKQAREASYLFGDASFVSATLDFSTDISPTAESIAVSGSAFANPASSQGYPIRTYLPREKQIATQYQAGMTVTNALASWKLEGISVTFRELSERTTR